ncbi:MAG: hypothetical protein H7Y07_08625 [Pyrinomonadaceae bacterium]|nr:hypothetical protein [Sphingobacteriaceae bacterium]
MKLTFKSLVFLIFSLLLSCTNEKSTPSDTTKDTSSNSLIKGVNPSVFKKSASNSKEYKDELASSIKSNPDKFTYTFERYIEDKNTGKEYLVLRVTNTSIDASAMVLVKNWNKLEGIKASKGLGYSGAELRGLRLDIEESPTGVIFIYKNLEKIID